MSKVDLPDFEDMMLIAERIRECMLSKISLDAKIKIMESDTVKKVTTDEKYFNNGKPPAMNFIEAVYIPAGVDGEIVPLRMELANAISELEYLKLKFDVMRMKLEVWKAESFAQKATSL